MSCEECAPTDTDDGRTGRRLLAQNVKRLRGFLAIEAFALKCGVPEEVLLQIEQEDGPTIDGTYAYRIAETFGTTIYDLMHCACESDAMTIQSIVACVCAYRFNHDDEKELQAGIAAAFDLRGIEYGREVHLSSKDVPDFMVGAIAVEVKITGSAAAVTRQLDRYAAHDRVRAVLLLTTSPSHAVIRGPLRGKPVNVVKLRGNFP